MQNIISLFYILTVFDCEWVSERKSFTSEQRQNVTYERKAPRHKRVSEWKGLYVQATQEGYIWTRKAQKYEN